MKVLSQARKKKKRGVYGSTTLRFSFSRGPSHIQSQYWRSHPRFRRRIVASRRLCTYYGTLHLRPPLRPNQRIAAAVAAAYILYYRKMLFPEAHRPFKYLSFPFLAWELYIYIYIRFRCILYSLTIWSIMVGSIICDLFDFNMKHQKERFV